jgi:hypothetical protein
MNKSMILLSLAVFSNIPFTALGWDCSSDCWNELKHCVRRPWGGRTCFPPEPTSYAACNAAKGASCAAIAARPDVIH